MTLALALQDVPGQKQTENALDTLAGQGILGSLCVLLIIALFFTVKALLKAKDDRFADQKLMTETLEKHNEAAKDLAIELNKATSSMMVEQTKNLDILKNALTNQEDSFEDTADALHKLQEEVMELKLTIRSKP